MIKRFIPVLLFAVLLCGTASGQFANVHGTPEEKAIDAAQMKQIWKALMSYVADKGQTPDFLSDLVPEYLPNKEVLISPVQRRTGVSGDNGFQDPKLQASYCYEFSGHKFARSERSFRDLKNLQMQEFGAVVPILRCFLYPRVLNVSYSGDVYETAMYWESAPEAREVTKRIGLGAGFKEGDFCSVTVVDAKTEKPLAGCEVHLTNRLYYSLPLPDRTLTTDEDGKVQVPLGPNDHPVRTLSISVSKPGYEPARATWTAKDFQEVWNAKLEPVVTPASAF